MRVRMLSVRITAALLTLAQIFIVCQASNPGACVKGLAKDSHGNAFGCERIDLIAHLQLKEYYPVEDTSAIGHDRRTYGSVADSLCNYCGHNQKKHDDQLPTTFTKECKESIQEMMSGPCAEDTYNEDRSPKVCYLCDKEMTGNVQAVRQQCLLGFKSFCDNEVGQTDLWGWRDLAHRRDYILAGLRHGVSVVDVTHPEKPIVVALVHQPKPRGVQSSLPCAASWWKDIKVLDDRYMIVASEAALFGLRVFDLHQLRDFNGTAAELREVSCYTGISSTHNIVIGEGSMVYAVGTNTCAGGLHVVDYSNPQRPRKVACHDKDGYVHDCQCDRYHGKDQRYRAREICFCGAPGCSPSGTKAGSGGLGIFDVEDKTNITLLSCQDYPNKDFPHQGWLNYDHSIFYLGDEGDEDDSGVRTTTFVWNIDDLEQPKLLKLWVNNKTKAIDHNIFYHNGALFQTNYEAGLRILLPTTKSQGYLEEVAYFDTTNGTAEVTTMKGTWASWPFFDNGIVVVGDEHRGLFILRLHDDVRKMLKDEPKKQWFPATTNTYGGNWKRNLMFWLFVAVAVGSTAYLGARACELRNSDRGESIDADFAPIDWNDRIEMDDFHEDPGATAQYDIEDDYDLSEGGNKLGPEGEEDLSDELID